ncbi:uncharacterized protein BJX67DRAFT_376889 [Aspergillus lucknowensis]|uniref:Nucleotidyltransferase family protein n=1 Tax=Aspergillus lucknowensis TaxID=176173 RepID=A0ABR4M616_9EURO
MEERNLGQVGPFLKGFKDPSEGQSGEIWIVSVALESRETATTDEAIWSKTGNADVAQILDDAGIPSVLWGWLALALFHEIGAKSEVDFVIPDHEVESATNALTASGFTPCGDVQCAELRVDRLPADHLDHWDNLLVEHRLLSESHVRCILAEDRFHAVAPVHFHIQSRYPHSGYQILSLHQKSSLLWSFPEFGPAPPPADDRNLIISDDPRWASTTGDWGSGPWENVYPMKVLTPWGYAEAVMLFYWRDCGHFQNLDKFWSSLLICLMEHDEHISGQLRPQFQMAWDWLNGRTSRREDRTWAGLWRLRDKLIADGELTDLPPRREGHGV